MRNFKVYIDDIVSCMKRFERYTEDITYNQ